MQIYLPHRRKHHSFANAYSVQFDGANEYAVTGGTSILGGAARSHSFWMKTSSTSFSCISNYGTQFNLVDWIIFMHFGSGVMYISNGSGATQFNSGNLADGAWRHYVFIYTGTNDTTLYVNGVSKGINSQSIGTLNTKASDPVEFGRWAGGYYFNGKLDEYSIWNKALSSTEVSEIYNAGDPTNLNAHSAAGNLVNWWRMGDGDTYPTLIDVKGGNNATMTNQEAGDIQTDVP